MTTAEERTKGTAAAAAYLERAGFTLVDQPADQPARIYALDGETLVVVEVTTRRTAKSDPNNATTTPTARKRYARLVAAARERYAIPTSAPARLDAITLLVIAPDRALLRHHRAVFVPAD